MCLTSYFRGSTRFANLRLGNSRSRDGRIELSCHSPVCRPCVTGKPTCRPYFAESDRRARLLAMRGRQTTLPVIFCGKWPANWLKLASVKGMPVKIPPCLQRCSAGLEMQRWFPGGRWGVRASAGFRVRATRSATGAPCGWGFQRWPRSCCC